MKLSHFDPTRSNNSTKRTPHYQFTLMATLITHSILCSNLIPAKNIYKSNLLLNITDKQIMHYYKYYSIVITNVNPIPRQSTIKKRI